MFMNLRKNKENIIYFIVSLLLLETVRVKYNKLVQKEQFEKQAGGSVVRRQKMLLMKASFLYAIFLFWLMFDYFTTLSGKISLVYPQAHYLKTNMALFLNGILSYGLTAWLIRFLLELYIMKMNEAFGFWKKLGRSAIDGTKAIVHAPFKAGGVVKDKLVDGVKSGSEKVRDTACVSVYAAGRLPENMKEAAQDSENWKYDELIAKISQLGIPALVLIIAVEFTGLVGAAAIAEALALLGGPWGIVGGLGVLGILVVISKGIGRYGFKAVFEGVLKNLYKKGHTKQEIFRKVEGYKMTRKMKASLLKYIEELSDKQNSGISKDNPGV